MTDHAAIERAVLAEVATATYSTTLHNLGVRLGLSYEQIDQALKALVLAGDLSIRASHGSAWVYRLRVGRGARDVEQAS